MTPEIFASFFGWVPYMVILRLENFLKYRHFYVGGTPIFRHVAMVHPTPIEGVAYLNAISYEFVIQ